MRSSRPIFLFCAGSALLASVSMAEVLQSSGQGGRLWASREGAEILVHGIEGGEIRVDLPPGAFLRDLEPMADGWMAAGRLPAGRGTDLLLIEGRESGADLLPVPERVGGRFRGQPVLMMERQRLVGLVWAEGNGHRELEIRAAAWQDEEWGPSDLVSPRGPGSQLASAGAVLEDGSWFVVWAAYDGQDDEILWSRRLGEEWSPPERLHSGNDVPDLTPALMPVDGGALVVWSWYDGNDYRLKSSHWLEGSWAESAPFGERGSGEPDLIRSGDHIFLVHPSVSPFSWTVWELDRAGERRRMAVVSKDSYSRPLVVLPEAGEEALRWVDGEWLLEWQVLP